MANEVQISTLAIRRATLADVDDLVAMTRDSFLDHVQWQIPKLARRYWQSALESPANEIWVWCERSGLDALSQLIFDVPHWARTKSALRYGLATRLGSLALHPSLLVRKVRKRQEDARLLGGPRIPQPLDPVARDRLIPVDPAARFEYGGVTIEPGGVLWHELVAIAPQCRGRGLARRILEHGRDRALDSGRSVLFGVCEATAVPWCKLHEKMQYANVHEGAGKITYARFL